ncbi:MAG: NAD(P)/FAD-dependent oxidoreductase [Desulfobacterales bacterium]|nr:NAD(P)/FAD-dependent oxidoreductase [Desulfobacterales bacterium]
MKKKYDVVIIGAGLGGLTCALGLIKKGLRVRLFEKEPKAGGCQAYFKRRGFYFESCMHSVAETYAGGPVLNALSAVGLDPLPDFVRLDPSFCFIFPDKTYAVPPAVSDYKTMLKSEFPDESQGIERIFDTMTEIYEGLGRLPEITPKIARYGGSVFQEILDESLAHPRLKAVISGFWGYLGLPPSKTSALILSAFNASICNHGNYFPAGGITVLVDQLKDAVIKKGGEISFKSKVEKILIRDGRACGIRVAGGDEIFAHRVVSNIDATATFFQMVGEEYLPADFISRMRRLAPTLSAFSVYLGIEGKDLPQNVCVANLVYPGDDLEKQYEAVLKGDLEAMPWVVSIPTLAAPALAPPDHHILSLFAPIPYRLPGMTDWRERKGEYADRFIRVAEKIFPGLKKRIVVSEAATPDTLVRYTGNREGALGWNYTPESIAGRPENKSPVSGLWLTGHWTVPGVGVHGAVQSGFITSQAVASDLTFQP